MDLALNKMKLAEDRLKSRLVSEHEVSITLDIQRMYDCAANITGGALHTKDHEVGSNASEVHTEESEKLLRKRKNRMSSAQPPSQGRHSHLSISAS